MGVPAPTDRRLRRAQAKPPRKRRGWSERRWAIARRVALAGLLALALQRSAHLILYAPALRIERITVRGNERVSQGEVLAVLGGLRGQNILFADIESWRRRLLLSPWVAHAALRRVLPDRIEVLLDEREPIGIGRVGGHLYLVDAHGTIIDDYGPNYRQYDLPIIDGLAPAPGRGAAPLIDEARAGLAARLLEALADRRELMHRVSQIDVSDPHDAVVLLVGDRALIHVGEERFIERLQQYLELSPALRRRVPAVDYVDLRFEDRVYVRPAGDERTRADARTAIRRRRGD
jgi:cell division septal protein FtsQ